MNTKEEILSILRTVEVDGMDNVIKWLCDDSDFFIAPASSMYHLNIKGGLSIHSLSVYKTLDKLCETFGIAIPTRTKKITGILHDVCKTNTYFEKTVPDKYGSYYRDDKFPIGHGDKSVIILLNNGLKMTEEEMLMIRWHMYMYDESYPRSSKYIRKVCPNAKILSFADDISTTYLEE